MKVAYFDYWTLGIQNFLPIDSKLKEIGHETVLLHVGSFNFPQLKEETVKGIKCKDISFFNTTMIWKMLEKEMPDILITLNTTLVLDRVVTISCRHLNIKSIFIMHGNRNYGESNEQLKALFEKSYNSFTKKIKKLPKYLSIIIPNYLYALYKYNPSNIVNLRFLKVIFSYFKNPGKSVFLPDYTDEIIQDKCLVYSNNEKKYYEQLNYSEDNIQVVGNPKFDSLLDMITNNKFTTDMLPDSVKKLVSSNTKYALMLEEAFPEQNNIGGYTAEVREKFILGIAERLLTERIKLVVKLHPDTNIDTINIKHNNLEIERDYLDGLIYFSEFCIANLSTTISNCILMGKPVLSPNWDAAKNLPPFFSDIGVTNRWNSVDEELNLSINDDARQRYIKEYITVITPDAVNNILQEINA